MSAPAHDPSLTNVEVMRKGLGHIRKGAGDDVFFSGCAASQNMRTYAGTIGLVDSMRVGPDFNHDGQGIRSGPLRGSWMYFLNGKVERSHRIDAEEFYRLLDGVVLDDAKLFNDKLQEWEDYYNYHRPHGALGGQTPYERLRQKTQTRP